eukprot:m.28777 g.28777  ORF g.28777 m.28777 type:complete len:250 (-) comp4596_c0_seq2:192-941(-)
MASPYRTAKPKKPRSMLLLAVPLAAAGLGFWQLERLKWKKGLIAQLHEGLDAPPVPVPANLEELRDMDYRRVLLTGTFDHANEILIAPRTLRNDSPVAPTAVGAHVVTPFRLSGTHTQILVNRGFVPVDRKPAATRPDSQVQGEVSFSAIVRADPKKAQFVPENDPATKQWYWADVATMASLSGSQPYLVDACADATPRGGLPIGGQTLVTVRNQHMEYAMTWWVSGRRRVCCRLTVFAQPPCNAVIPS